jgi:hypothetical protein
MKGDVKEFMELVSEGNDILYAAMISGVDKMSVYDLMVEIEKEDNKFSFTSS